MIKTDLPVILLRGIVLLPNNEIRLEFENDESKNIIDVAELFHDNKVLVASQIDPLEESPDVQELPKIGVIAKINHKIELPNGKLRVVLTGVARAEIYEYLNLSHNSEVLESIVSALPVEEMDEQRESVLLHKLYQETENYAKLIPYMSNSILATLVNVTSLDRMTDLIAPNLPIHLPRYQEYLMEPLASKRAEMILFDIYQEEEMYHIEKELDLKVKKQMDQSQKDYIMREKIRLMKEELGDLSIKDTELDSLYKKANEIQNDAIKERLLQELKRYESSPELSPETNIIYNYINWLLDLPWNVKTIDNPELKNVRLKLDQSHSGLEKVKTRIIEYLAVKQKNPELRGPILCFVGPPGVGKTTLAFSIAEAMNRNFVKMSVGGVNDEAEIVGHRRTYLGASPGRIIQSLKKAKSSNPVFLIDEIDKMTKDFKGDPASCLLEVLDPEQNKLFSDHYIEEEVDLSQVMFLTTANAVEEIPEALKDRLEIVELSGYTEYEKIDIARKHLIPKICKEHGLEEKYILFDQEVLLYMIRSFTKEAGVRELERQIATVIRKIVTSIVVDRIHVNGLHITKKNLEQYLGKPKFLDTRMSKEAQIGVVNGLAYTKFGGDILPIEVNFFPGRGDLVLTGSLGEVMKESAIIALSYLKSNCAYFHIDYHKLTKNNIHIHVPEGAVPKDGPSAGVTLITVLVSAFTDLKIPVNIAMTGEVTLRGNVLPIGGLKEKCIGAHRNGIKTIFLPKENESNLEEIPLEVKKEIEFILVEDYKEIYQYLMKEQKHGSDCNIN